MAPPKFDPLNPSPSFVPQGANIDVSPIANALKKAAEKRRRGAFAKKVGREIRDAQRTGRAASPVPYGIPGVTGPTEAELFDADTKIGNTALRSARIRAASAQLEAQSRLLDLEENGTAGHGPGGQFSRPATDDDRLAVLAEYKEATQTLVAGLPDWAAPELQNDILRQTNELSRSVGVARRKQIDTEFIQSARAQLGVAEQRLQRAIETGDIGEIEAVENENHALIAQSTNFPSVLAAARIFGPSIQDAKRQASLVRVADDYADMTDLESRPQLFQEAMANFQQYGFESEAQFAKAVAPVALTELADRAILGYTPPELPKNEREASNHAIRYSDEMWKAVVMANPAIMENISPGEENSIKAGLVAGVRRRAFATEFDVTSGLSDSETEQRVRLQAQAGYATQLAEHWQNITANAGDSEFMGVNISPPAIPATAVVGNTPLQSSVYAAQQGEAAGKILVTAWPEATNLEQAIDIAAKTALVDLEKDPNYQLMLDAYKREAAVGANKAAQQHQKITNLANAVPNTQVVPGGLPGSFAVVWPEETVVALQDPGTRDATVLSIAKTLVTREGGGVDNLKELAAKGNSPPERTHSAND